MLAQVTLLVHCWLVARAMACPHSGSSIHIVVSVNVVPGGDSVMAISDSGRTEV